MPEDTITISITKYDRLLRAAHLMELLGTFFEEKVRDYEELSRNEVRSVAKMLGYKEEEEC
jgi:hypothetical protein